LSNSPEIAEPPLTLEDIDVGVAAVATVVTPDRNDQIEDLAAQRAALDLKLARSRIKDVKADRRMRKTYAGRILRYLEIYSGIVAAMVIAAGFRLFGFTLPVEILATLVGSTAVAAIGLVGFIARGLFKTPPEHKH
jgi:hypothetical protein